MRSFDRGHRLWRLFASLAAAGVGLALLLLLLLRVFRGGNPSGACLPTRPHPANASRDAFLAKRHRDTDAFRSLGECGEFRALCFLEP